MSRITKHTSHAKFREIVIESTKIRKITFGKLLKDQQKTHIALVFRFPFVFTFPCQSDSSIPRFRPSGYGA